VKIMITFGIFVCLLLLPGIGHFFQVGDNYCQIIIISNCDDCWSRRRRVVSGLLRRVPIVWSSFMGNRRVSTTRKNNNKMSSNMDSIPYF